MSSNQVYALSFHDGYRCRHSGACCTADWDVPVELPVYRSLEEAVAAGRLRPPPRAAHLDPFIVEPDLPDEAAAMLERTDGGACVFLDPGSRLCIVHRDLGEPALPATCRHFPRVAVRDVRGTFVTLSHFCPTAAGMLFRDDVPVSVVASPRAFPPADYEGLIVDADELPPLLAPATLMDPDGYTAWELHMVARCAGVERRPESVLATLVRDAAILRHWRPGRESLVRAVAGLPPGFEEGAPHRTLDLSLRFHAEAMAAVPDDLRPAPDEAGLEAAFGAWVAPAWPRFHAPVNRYVAAKAFASWTAYQGRGVATIVRGLDAALALVRVEAARQCRNAGRPLDRDLLLEAFRRADFTLNHLATGEELAEIWGSAER
jgi:Fe-S-cluster containining protein